MLNRKGIIRIPRSKLDKEPEKVLEMLNGILVLSVEYNPLSMRYDYITCSKYFDKVEPMEEIPCYDFVEMNDKIRVYRIPNHFKPMY